LINNAGFASDWEFKATDVPIKYCGIHFSQISLALLS
jgi:hypothetical protein